MVAKEMSLANKSLVEFEMEMAEWSEAVMEAAWPCEDQEISEWGEEFCSKCDQCHHCDKCKWCEWLGCWINENCKLCYRCPVACVSGGFCGDQVCPCILRFPN